MILHALAGFTVDGQGGRVGPSGQDWVAGLLAALPRLERLALEQGWFGVRGIFRGVEELITAGLPAAGAAAGRRLEVLVNEGGPPEWDRNDCGFDYGPAPR